MFVPAEPGAQTWETAVNSSVIHRLGELQLEGLRLGAHIAEWSLNLERLARQLTLEEAETQTELLRLRRRPMVNIAGTGVDKLRCPHCGKVCMTASALGSHLAARRRNGVCLGETTSATPNAPQPKRPRLTHRSSAVVGIHICKYCKEDLDTGAGLSAHYRGRAKTGRCKTVAERAKKRKYATQARAKETNSAVPV